MSDFRRGGFSSPYNDYSSWINNGNSTITDTRKYRIDGSWLNNGEYERAFKGFPTNKNVNVFIGGGYSVPSWQSTFLSGGIAMGIRGLGLWALSGLFKKNKPQQTTIQGNMNIQFPNYFGSVGSIFGIAQPNSTSVDLSGNVTKPDDKAKGKPDDKVKGKPDDKKVEDPSDDSVDNVKKGKDVTDDINSGDIEIVGVASRKNFRTEDIQGGIEVIAKADSSTNGYPKKFVIKDKTNNPKGATDNQSNDYVFRFDSIKDGKPFYELVSGGIHTDKEDPVKFNKGNLFVVNSGFAAKQNEQGIFEFVSNNGVANLDMSTYTGESASVQNKGKIDFAEEQVKFNS